MLQLNVSLQCSSRTAFQGRWLLNPPRETRAKIRNLISLSHSRNISLNFIFFFFFLLLFATTTIPSLASNNVRKLKKRERKEKKVNEETVSSSLRDFIVQAIVRKKFHDLHYLFQNNQTDGNKLITIKYDGKHRQADRESPRPDIRSVGTPTHRVIFDSLYTLCSACVRARVCVCVLKVQV